VSAPSTRSRALLIAAALLLLPGLWLRFHALEWMEFAGDEYMILCESYRAGHEQFALTGMPASIGLPLPNFLFYVLALPVSCTRDPVQVVVFVALWNLLGLACVLRLLWRMLPPATAVAATALLASAPGPLFLARKIWNPDFLFGGLALLLLLLTLQMERPRRWVTAGLFVVCAILCGFHASAWPLLPCVLAWGWLLRVPFERRGIWIGALALLVLFAPYLVYFVQSQFDDLRGMWSRHGTGAARAGSWLAAFASHARAALDASCTGELLGSASGWSRAVALVFSWWTAIASLVVLVRTPWIVLRARKGLEVAAIDKLLALGAGFEIVLLALYATEHMPTLPHYYAALIPFPTLAAVWLGWRCCMRFGEVPLVAASALVVGAHTLLFTGFLGELKLHGVPPGVHYAQPYFPHAAEWRARIASSFDAIDSEHAAERAEAERLRLKFEASNEVLMRYDAQRDDPPAVAFGRLDLRPGPGGLEVFGSTAIDLLQLPPFELGGRGRALVRIELWSPKRVPGLLLYGNEENAEFARSRVLEMKTHHGENVFYFEIPDPKAAGRLTLRHAAQRWVLRAAEIRRVEG